MEWNKSHTWRVKRDSEGNETAVYFKGEFVAVENLCHEYDPHDPQTIAGTLLLWFSVFPEETVTTDDLDRFQVYADQSHPGDVVYPRRCGAVNNGFGDLPKPVIERTLAQGWAQRVAKHPEYYGSASIKLLVADYTVRSSFRKRRYYGDIEGGVTVRSSRLRRRLVWYGDYTREMWDGNSWSVKYT